MFQQLTIKKLIEQYFFAEKNQNDDNFLKVIQDDLKDIELELNYSSTSNDLYGKLIEIKKYVDKEITNYLLKQIYLVRILLTQEGDKNKQIVIGKFY